MDMIGSFYEIGSVSFMNIVINKINNDFNNEKPIKYIL